MNELILKLARDAIEAKLFGKPLISKYKIGKDYPDFLLKKATFVTLKINGRLRGCIGSLIAHRELYDDLVSNAQSAAFSDPRFPSLSEEEFKRVDIEVSLLTEPIALEYSSKDDLKSKIKIGVDGIILISNGHQATFLPQVWEELNDFELFFSHLCQKAGLEGNCLDRHPDIYKYQVEKVG